MTTRSKARHTFLASLIAVTVVLTALVQPAVAQTSNTGWQGEYFTNRDLGGAPAVVRTDADINFNWGLGAPDVAVPADNFSVRWSRSLYFEGGRYRFIAEVDDGVRLYVDGQIVLDRWVVEPRTQHQVVVDLTPGVHTVWMEYFEAGGDAYAKLSWGASEPNNPIVDWRGEYFINRTLWAAPALVRNDKDINFNWGIGAPAAGIPADNFSVRWTRSLYFSAGRYRFTTTTDDGVRLYVDGQLLINQWREMAPTTFNVDVGLVEGWHEVRMEYFEAGGGAAAQLVWSRISDQQPQPSDVWYGEYYNNPWLSGQPSLARNDSAINFAWGTGTPDARLNVDNFSVRWSRNLTLEAGRYRFTTTTDDGVRLFVDGQMVIDQWREQAQASYTRELFLAAGVHAIRLEYFEKAGLATARLSIEGPLAYPTSGNLITCVPPPPTRAWVKAYQLGANGNWIDVNPNGWGAINSSGYLKIDALPVDYLRYGQAGHPYRIEIWAEGTLIRSVGNTAQGEAEFRIRPNADNETPWGCPAPSAAAL